ncbi:hypothetical protein YTPLAS73_09900 [Nitrosarchaeum sp.]|nr:hypothetical protein YTPLAS73_09900 [Nitrosarchaeum sp.]
MNTKQDVQLYFAEEGTSSSTEDYVSKGIDDKFKGFSTSIDKVIGWFDKYQVQSIELWIQAAAETGGILKLLVSAKGEGGMKITLVPKTQ